MRKSGKKSCRYSFLVIRYAIALKLKMGHDKYEFLSRVFNMPCSRTLDSYSNIAVHAPDGVLFDSLHVNRENFETKNPNLSIEDWKRHGSLAWDSMVVKEKLEYNTHSMRIVGFADDAFDLDIIKKELANRIRDNNQEESREETDSGNESKNDDSRTAAPKVTTQSSVPLAKHFLVFMFTSWELHTTRHQFVVARYAVKSLDAAYLCDKILAIISSLAKYGFIVDTITGDGASENRSVFKTLSTLSFKDILADKLTHVSQEIINKFPVDFKIAFEHPTIEGLYIFIAGDMPHLVKKIVNAFERSGISRKKTKLSFKGQRISLKMIQKYGKILVMDQ